MNKKKIILALALIGGMATQSRAELVGDTLVIEDVKKVRIETRDTVQRLVINGSKDDEQFHYVQRISIPDTSAVRRTIKSVKDFNKITIKGKDGKPSKWESSLHINLGLNTLLSTPSDYDFKVWPSFDLGLTWLADFSPYGKQNVWSIGLGIDYRRYEYDKDKYLVKDHDVIFPADFSDEKKERSSDLTVSSLQLPIMYTHYFDRKQEWGITLGALVNWNFHATVNHEYEVGDNHYDISTKKIGQRPITVDGMAILYIPSFPDIYCKYTPMTLFKDGRGPKAHQLSFGLYL